MKAEQDHCLTYAICVSVISLLMQSSTVASATCTVESAASQVRIDNIERNAHSAKAMLPLLSELSAINAKAKDPRRKLVDQLAAIDAVRFSELSQRLASVKLSSHVESGHERDAEVVASTFHAAWRLYEGVRELPEGPDLIPTALISAMRQTWPNTEVSLASKRSDGCSVEIALSLARDDALRTAINNPGVGRNAAVIRSLQQKYGVIDRKKMSAEDAREVARANAELLPVFASQRLAEDIQNILDWWSAANIVYETRKEDIATYGAEYTKMGTTLDLRKDLSDRTRKMIQYWHIVNEKVPSEAQKDEAIIGEAVKKAEPHH